MQDLIAIPEKENLNQFIKKVSKQIGLIKSTGVELKDHNGNLIKIFVL